ncbi:hypothetical protein N4Q71_06515 [Salmonella enterica subsp. enterica serovar Montevideo]
MKVKLLAAGILFTLPFWACAKDVTIIYTNDLHAHVEPYKVPWIADFAIESRWYRDNPLVIRGPGAGRDVTAGAIQSDINRLAQLL